MSINRIGEMDFYGKRVGLAEKDGKLVNWLYELTERLGVPVEQEFQKLKSSYMAIRVHGDDPHTALIETQAVDDWVFANIYASEARQDLRLDLKRDQGIMGRSLQDALWRSSVQDMTEDRGMGDCCND